MHFDLTLKDLFSALPQNLFRHLCGVEVAELRSIEVPAAVSRPDLFGRLADGQYFHGELQSEGRPRMGWRMLGYRWFFYEHLGIEDLVQVVFVLRNRGPMPAGLERRNLSYQYQVVDFAEIDAAVLAAGNKPEEHILSVLGRGGGKPEHVRQVLRECLKCDRARRDVLIGHLQVLSGLRPGLDRVIETEIQSMPLTIDLRENVMFRGPLAEAEQKGRAEGHREFLAGILEQKFGPLSQEHRDRLRQATEADLQRWVTRVLTAVSLEDALG